MWRWAVVLAAVILGGIGAWAFTSTEEEIRVPAELAPAEVPPFNAPAAEPQPVEPAVSSDIIEPAPVVEEPSWVLPPLASWALCKRDSVMAAPSSVLLRPPMDEVWVWWKSRVLY